MMKLEVAPQAVAGGLHLSRGEHDEIGERSLSLPDMLLGRWSNLGVLFSVLFIGFTSYFTLHSKRLAEKDFDRVVQTQTVQKTLQSALGNAIDAVPETRGSTMTAQEKLLEARAWILLEGNLDSLRWLMVDNAGQRRRLGQLESLVRVRQHTSTASEAKTGKSEHVSSDIALTEDDEHYMGVFRSVVGEMQDEEVSILVLNIAAAQESKSFVRIIVGLSASMGASLLLLSGLSLGRQINRGARLQAQFQHVNAQLELQSHRFHLAADSGHIGIWDWDIVHDHMAWDHWVYLLYGMGPREQEETHEFWRRHVHPDDQESTERQLQEAMRGVRPFDTEFRVTWDDGSVHFIRGTGQVTRDETGRATRMLGTSSDVSAQRQSKLELAKLASFMESIITSSPFATIVTDLLGVITSVNPAAERMLQYDRRELINLETPMVFLSPKEVASRAVALSDELHTTIVSGIDVLTANPRRGKLDEAHWAVIRRDGSSFEAQFTVAALTDIKSNVVGYILIAYDITEQQQAERHMLQALAEKEVLLKEIHHRVKNNLQVICSLLNMQAASASDLKIENALVDSYNRVHSMAMIHEMLYGSVTLSDIDFGTYARALVQELITFHNVQHGRIQTSFIMSPMPLSLNRAVPCGLILNELISNSLKYAFPGSRDGAILVSLILSDADHCEILVEDNGVGLPEDFSTSRSLGLRIVDILVKQLEGEYTLTSNNGTQFRMTFPLESAVIAFSRVPADVTTEHNLSSEQRSNRLQSS